MVHVERAPWETPELIVLVRNRPEEAVLTKCKSEAHATGSKNKNATCWGPETGPSCGTECSTQIGS